jgi:hypothetical protein
MRLVYGKVKPVINAMVKRLFAILLSSGACMAGAADLSALATFEGGPVVEEASHVVLLHPAGLYRYGPASDERMRSKPFVIGTALRDDYQLFSWQEEEALWYVLQEQLDQIEVNEPKKARKIKAAFKERIDWPRVVIKGQNTVCVPELPRAKQDDWRDHLLCTDIKGVLE